MRNRGSELALDSLVKYRRGGSAGGGICRREASHRHPKVPVATSNPVQNSDHAGVVPPMTISITAAVTTTLTTG